MAVTITIAEAQKSCGTLSSPSKMPGKGISTPAAACITGTKLRDVKGSVCEGCYAFERGAYAWPNVKPALENRLSLVMASRENPEPWIAGMTKLIWNQEYFRWHDSGDLQGAWHFANIVEVARRTPHVKHWIPTREYRMLSGWTMDDLPANLCPRTSGHMVDGACSGMNTTTGQWEDCRKCWDTSNQNTAYPKH